MKLINGEFPNPVLAAGRDDYIQGCNFVTALAQDKILTNANNITLPMSYTLQCGDLEKLVKSGEVTVVINVKSSAASFSKIFSFSATQNQMKISIPLDFVVNKIDIEGFIVATHDIPAFQCKEFNSLYFANMTFEIAKGQILAIGTSTSVPLSTDVDKPVASIFSIIKSDEAKSDVTPSFEDEKILILLKSELYDLYYKFKDFNNGILRRYANVVIVYPVLVEAVGYVIGHYQNQDEDSDDEMNNDEYSGKRWFKSIVRQIEALGISLDNIDRNPTTLANDLLDDIAFDALKCFDEILDSEMNSGEAESIGGID